MMEQQGCLIIHGFTGGPSEVMPLAEYISRKGYTTAVPTLAGHGNNVRDLNKFSYLDWIASAEVELKELFASHRKVYIIGFSMGGLIGLHLAQKYPIQGLVTLSTPIYLLDKKRLLENIVKELKNKEYRRIKKYTGNVLRTPLKAVIHFKTLLSKSKRLIPVLTTPLLVIQGLKDETVKPKSANYIFQYAGSSKKQLCFLPESGHLICCDCEKQRVFELVKTFLDNTNPSDPRI